MTDLGLLERASGTMREPWIADRDGEHLSPFGLFPLIHQMSFHYSLSFPNSCFTLLESMKDTILHRFISGTSL